jgi:hypothetical protein
VGEQINIENGGLDNTSTKLRKKRDSHGSYTSCLLFLPRANKRDLILDYGVRARVFCGFLCCQLSMELASPPRQGESTRGGANALPLNSLS